MQPSTPKDTTHDEAKKFIEEIYRDLHGKGELIYSYQPGVDTGLFFSLIKAEFPCLLYQNHFRLKVYLNSYRVDNHPACLVRNVYARLYNEKIMHLDFNTKYCNVDQIFQYIKEEFPNLSTVMEKYTDDVMRITITFKKEQIPIQKEKESLAFQKEKERIIQFMNKFMNNFEGLMPFRLHVTECNKELISEIEKLYPDFEFCHVANSLLIDKKGHKERVALIVKEIEKLRSGGIDAMVYIAHIMNVKSIVQEMKEKYPFIGFKVEGEYSLCLSPINEQYESEKQTLTEAVKKSPGFGSVCDLSNSERLVKEFNLNYPAYEFYAFSQSEIRFFSSHFYSKTHAQNLLIEEVETFLKSNQTCKSFTIFDADNIVQSIEKDYPQVEFKVICNAVRMARKEEPSHCDGKTCIEKMEKITHKEEPSHCDGKTCIEKMEKITHKEEPSHCDGKTHIEKMEKIQLEQLKKLLCIGTETYKYKVHLSHEKWEFGKVTKKNIEVLKEYGYKTHQGLTGLSLEWEV